MTILITALTLLFGASTICPIGSQEFVTPIGPSDDWSRMECGYVDNSFNHVCIESFTPDSVTWAARDGRYITAAFLRYTKGTSEIQAIDPYAVPETMYVSGNGQQISTIAWCGSLEEPTIVPTQTFLPFFSR